MWGHDLTCPFLKRSVKYMLASSTKMGHKQHTSDTAELFDIPAGFLFSKTLIQRWKVTEVLLRLYREIMRMFRDEQVILVGNSLYKKKKQTKFISQIIKQSRVNAWGQALRLHSGPVSFLPPLALPVPLPSTKTRTFSPHAAMLALLSSV